MNIRTIKRMYEIYCNEFIKKFAEKQDIEFEYWVSDEVDGIAAFVGEEHTYINYKSFTMGLRYTYLQPKNLNKGKD